jgi:uncharacterized cofD-like protein
MKSIVIFGGGSGTRGLTLALCRRDCALTRIVPAWDSGGSSRALRQVLGILPVGDIRQALMTLAQGEGRAGSVVKFFNARLSEDPRCDLRREFDSYADAMHPLLQAMRPGVRAVILDFLAIFRSRIGEDFDFRRGSIGNFVLTGAYFGCGEDINKAILAFRQLCGIAGNVWPVSPDASDLDAELGDGTRVAGQHRLTALPPQQAAAGIRRIHLAGAQGAAGSPAPVRANPAALAAIQRADTILFGPGSFFTSVLPHLLVPGVVETIRQRQAGAPRVLIGNILECPETVGRALGDLVGVFEELAKGAGGPPFLSHVIANRRQSPVRTVVNGFAYLESEGLQASGIQVIAANLEDDWRRGVHDAEALAELVLALG